MSNTFYLSPFLFSHCFHIHFSKRGTPICGRIILQKKLSSHLSCFLYFALILFFSQELVGGTRQKIFRIPWLLQDSTISILLKLWIVGQKNGLFYAFLVRYLASRHLGLACCRELSNPATHYHLMLLYKNQLKNKSCKKFSTEMNQKSYNWFVRQGSTLWHHLLCPGLSFRYRDIQKEVQF